MHGVQEHLGPERGHLYRDSSRGQALIKTCRVPFRVMRKHCPYSSYGASESSSCSLPVPVENAIAW